MAINKKFQRRIEEMSRTLFSRSPLADLLDELEREIPALLHELDAIDAEQTLLESVTVSSRGNTVTTQILVPLDAKASEITVSLREGVLTVTTPLVTRKAQPTATSQSIPVDVK